jgi:hypothetical protein
MMTKLLVALAPAVPDAVMWGRLRVGVRVVGEARVPWCPHGIGLDATRLDWEPENPRPAPES